MTPFLSGALGALTVLVGVGIARRRGTGSS